MGTKEAGSESQLQLLQAVDAQANHLTLLGLRVEMPSSLPQKVVRLK